MSELEKQWSDVQASVSKIREATAEVIVGQEAVVEQMMVSLLCKGHCLLVGVPGLAKTLLVSTLGKILGLKFNRIQFTPDLMPTDIVGSEILQMDGDGGRSFEYTPGPIFANLILADEINRTPPKTQAALLEAMQEHHVTVGEKTCHLPDPFFVLATQNPIEQEGTYPLPEAQLDRFLFNIVVDYPDGEEEREIIRRVTSPGEGEVKALMTAEEIINLQDIVKRVPVGDHVIDFAADIARATRPNSGEAPEFVKDMVGWGAGPRAGIALISAAKAHAVLRGRFHATTGDVAAVAPPVLRHRVLTTFNAEASGVTSDSIVEMLLEHLQPKEEIKI